MGQLVAAEMQCLQSAATPQNERALEQAFLLLSGAERIVVQAGLGMEGLDSNFAGSLRALGFLAWAAPEGISREILELDDRSVLVSIGGHYYSGLLGPLRYARVRNAGVLVLTEDETAPMRQYADAMLVGKGLAAVAVLITALLSVLEKNGGSRLEANLAELDALHGEYHTYEFTEN